MKNSTTANTHDSLASYFNKYQPEREPPHVMTNERFVFIERAIELDMRN